MRHKVVHRLVFRLCIASTFAAAPVHAAVQYYFTDLGSGQANGINDSNIVVGLTGSLQAFVYSNGVLNEFGRSLPDPNNRADAIDPAGVIVGTMLFSSQNNIAFSRQPNGTVTNIPLLDAHAINSNGVIAGDHINGGVVDAATYSGATVTDLGTLGGNASVAYGLNNSQLVVGGAKDSTGLQHATSWQNGVINSLDSISSVARAVNSSGQIVGSQLFKNSVNHAMLWQNGTQTDLSPNDLFADSQALAINDAGTIVGSDGHAAIWQNGVETLLESLTFDLPPNLFLNAGLGINDSGVIVGQAFDTRLQEHIFLLTPVPLPLGVLGFGLTTVTALISGIRLTRSRNLPKHA